MISVAIDGPAGVGKSTAAKAVAKKLGYIYVDTGALYRAIGLFASERNIGTTDAAGISAKLHEIRIKLDYLDGVQRVFLNGRDVSDDIRKPEMGMAASNVSAIPKVRDFLLDLQRDMAAGQNVVMDGRDIGTVVLPGAKVKIYLTASAEARAKRRFEEHVAKGEQVSYNDILTEIKQRDYNDMNRSIAPLKQAGDAVLIDNTGWTCKETADQIMKIIEEKTV
ncbi:MAG: (d)CMP kinase [Oscillospiraceae bacterium]|nr:(d)CMP kinase [Oscillospiraceae bacterium]